MNEIIFGDCSESMTKMIADGVRVQTCVTSPPYFGLRDYGVEGQLGQENTPQEYINNLVEVFRKVRGLLNDDGTLWLNIGDSYEDKNLLGTPWRLASALQAEGWYLRQDIIWHKPNAMPESVTDRCTKAHEYLFLLSKSAKYYFDYKAIQEPAAQPDRVRKDRFGGTKYTQESSPGFKHSEMSVFTGSAVRNRRSVWSIATRPYKGAHFATFPTDLVRPCVLAGSRAGDVVFDPFMGSGTVAQVAIEEGRQYLGCELNPEYKALQDKRISEAKAK